MDDARIWLVHSTEGACGPYTASEIREFRNQGIVNDHSYLWREGMAEWARLADIPAFAPPPAPIAPPPPPPAFAPAPQLGPLPSSPLPEFLRQGAPAPSEEVAAEPTELACPFSARQLRIGLAVLALAAIVVIGGAVPRPWWETPGLAFAVFGIEPDPPEEADPAPTNDEDDRGASSE